LNEKLIGYFFLLKASPFRAGRRSTLIILAMLAIALGMLYYFKRKEWL